MNKIALAIHGGAGTILRRQITAELEKDYRQGLSHALKIGWEMLEKGGNALDVVEATVAELKARGVVFEEVDLPGLKTVDSIAEVQGNYPSKGGKGERAAWFRDLDDNMFGIGQPL